MLTKRIAAIAVALAASGTAHADEWKWTVTPYLWATDLGIDLAIADRELVDTTIAFEDLLDDLETATQIRAEAMRGEHGLMLDVFNVGLADDNDRFELPDSSGGELILDTQTGMSILDLAGIYDPRADGTGISLFYGTRIINQQNEIDAQVVYDDLTGTSGSYDSDDTFVDGLVGMRYAGLLSGQWSYEFSADFSTGDTDLTWSVAPAIGFTFGASDQYTLTAGYRHMVVDFDTHDAVDMDMTLKGYLVGFRFKF